MAKNGIFYEGRVINNTGQSSLSKASTGKLVLRLVIAEQFQEKNSRAADKYKQADRGADEYVNTTTTWHKVTVFADADDAAFIALVTNPLFNHGCVVEVDASYREEDPWLTKDNVLRAGRPESIFWASRGEGGGGNIAIKELDDGRVLGARDEWAKPLWDGVSDLPAPGGSGGGPSAPVYENEGF